MSQATTATPEFIPSGSNNAFARFAQRATQSVFIEHRHLMVEATRERTIGETMQELAEDTWTAIKNIPAQVVNGAIYAWDKTVQGATTAWTYVKLGATFTWIHIKLAADKTVVAFKNGYVYVVDKLGQVWEYFFGKKEDTIEIRASKAHGPEIKKVMDAALAAAALTAENTADIVRELTKVFEQFMNGKVNYQATIEALNVFNDKQPVDSFGRKAQSIVATAVIELQQKIEDAVAAAKQAAQDAADGKAKPAQAPEAEATAEAKVDATAEAVHAEAAQADAPVAEDVGPQRPVADVKPGAAPEAAPEVKRAPIPQEPAYVKTAQDELNQQIGERFQAIFASIPVELPYNENWADQGESGHFTGVLADEELLGALKAGEMAKSVDITGRQLIFVQTKAGLVCVFKRFSKTRHMVSPYIAHASRPLARSHVLDEAITSDMTMAGMDLVFGKNDDDNIGLRIERGEVSLKK